jgi:small subunit ribosomal protein S2
MPFVNQRWLGGMLTNFSTVSGRVKRMQELRTMQAAGDFEGMPKREALSHTRELEKLSRNLSGIANLERLPNAVFVIDTKKEHIAVTEARKLGLPVVAVVDTNCDPDIIDYVIPGNDDAIRSGSLMCRVLADAVVEGRFIAEHRRKNAPPVPEEAPSGPSPRGRRVPAPPAPSAAAAAPAPAAAPVSVTPPEAAPVEEAPATAPANATGDASPSGTADVPATDALAQVATAAAKA